MSNQPFGHVPTGKYLYSFTHIFVKIQTTTIKGHFRLQRIKVCLHPTSTIPTNNQLDKVMDRLLCRTNNHDCLDKNSSRSGVWVGFRKTLYNSNSLFKEILQVIKHRMV